MNGLTFTNMAVVKADRLRMPIETAEKMLKNALVEGHLVATAAEGDSGRPVEIDTFKWAHIEVNDKGEMYFRKTIGQIAYNDVRFMRADVMRLWPASSEGEAAVANSRSGAPGRPTSMHLVEMEFRRRVAEGLAETSNVAESELLKEWLEKTHPSEPRLTAKTIRNRIGPIRREIVSARN
jgi:hypothetical protein